MERIEMYWADKHVEGMIFNLKEHSVTHLSPSKTIYEYRIPQHTPNLYTRIVGEWVEKTDGTHFLIHSWENAFTWNGGNK